MTSSDADAILSSAFSVVVFCSDSVLDAAASADASAAADAAGAGAADADDDEEEEEDEEEDEEDDFFLYCSRNLLKA